MMYNLVQTEFFRVQWPILKSLYDRNLKLHSCIVNNLLFLIGGDNSQTRSQKIQLTKIRWHLIAPPSTPDLCCKVGLNLALGLVADVWLAAGDLHAIGWGEGPWALVTPVKAIRVGVGVYNNLPVTRYVVNNAHRNQITAICKAACHAVWRFVWNFVTLVNF